MQDTIKQNQSRAYLAVDKFIDTLIKSRVIKTALDLGLIDHLIERKTSSLEILGKSIRCDQRGTMALVSLLQQSNVVINERGDLSLTTAFRQILPYRDLLQTKLSFAGLLVNDFSDYFSLLIQDPSEFQDKAQLFKLFSYTTDPEPDPETYFRTRLWMQLTSCLSKYEAGPFKEIVNFTGKERLLDVGGNSGAFGLALCQKGAVDSATIFDLPLVCNIGLNYVLGKPSSHRLSFIAGDIRENDLPTGHDLILFKSFLHDWDNTSVKTYLEKAYASLQTSGRLIIYERIALEPSSATTIPRPWGFGDLPLLLFFRSYRNQAYYVKLLENTGFEVKTSKTLLLDSEFCIIEAFKS
jgi:hypothetical protein